MSQIELPQHLSHNQRLVEHIRPADWQNPVPDGRYNLVVLGGGSAGLTAVTGAVALGAKVALIEKGFLGGDCLNVGCVPSKALIRAAKVVGEIRHGPELGVNVDGVSADFQSVMDHVRKARADIAPVDSAEHLREIGVDVYFGSAQFTGHDTLELNGQTIQFKRALIATGSRPAALPISGLDAVGFQTNETIWNMAEQPRNMAVIGAGSIGVELAQAFQRLGTQVTLFEIAPTILPRDDRDASAVVAAALQADGVDLCVGVEIKGVSGENGAKNIAFERNGALQHVNVDEILIAAGRLPNVEGLNLEAAGVQYDSQTIVVDDQLRTTNATIYAAGDVALQHKFTHAAGHAAGIVLQNALFPGFKRKVSELIMPWATYSDPEVAHVGLTPESADNVGISIKTFTQAFDEVDRAITDAETSGFIKVHVKKGSGQIVGATIVAKHASEMITQVTLAMKFDIKLGQLLTTVFPYPTQSEALNKAAMSYNYTRLTPRVKRVLNWWMTRSRR
jgi:pyruvate/2-oxoglutarate dehydrogenase complex dihydrolipoamide dehydrogenase (E3) component